MTENSRIYRGLAAIGVAARVLSASPLCAQTAIPNEPLATPEIVVSGVRPARDANEVKLTAAQARREPGTQGDPSKVLENLPGLARSPFGSDQLVLWGAAPEDTRVYVDGVEIPQLFHGSGIRSTVNGELLQSVSLSPGAYGPEYGRGIGGVVRLETRELPREGVHAALDVSTLDASAVVSGAWGDGVRVALGARYGLLDRALSAVNVRDIGDFFAVPRYRDYQAKAQIALRAQESLDITVLGSGDELTRAVGSSDPARTRSFDTSSSFQRVYLRYRRALDDGASVEVVPWVGRDMVRSDAQFGLTPAQLEQRAWRWGLRAEHRSLITPSTTLRLGMDFGGASAELSREGSFTIPPREGDLAVFGQPPGDDTNVDHWRATIFDVAPYAALDWSLGPLTLTPGFRGDGYLLQTSRKAPQIGQVPPIGQASLDAELEPRLAARLRLGRRVTLFGAAGLYSQPPAPADLSAVFGSPALGPALAKHASIGEAVDVTETLSANVVGFYRALSDLAVRDPSPTPKLASALIQTGVGRSYGVQILVRQRPWHGFAGSLAYTISRSERRDTPSSNERLFDYDEPHVLTLVTSKAFGAWSLGLRFRYASGAPRTPVIGALYDERDDRYQPIFGPQNSERLPAFWQLDTRLDRRVIIGQRAQLLAYVELLNVTNRGNGEEYEYSPSYAQRGIVTGLPFLGVVGARLEL